MAYTAKCDTASATKWWITGTGTGGVNRLAVVLTDNPSGVEENDNPGNYQPWSTFMTETVEDAVYLIHLYLEIGDGTTATTLTSLNEMVYFDGCGFRTLSAATCTLGALDTSWGKQGSTWFLNLAANHNLIGTSDTTAAINLYDSEIKLLSGYYLYFRRGTFVGRNFKLNANINGNQRIYFEANCALDWKSGFLSGWTAVNYFSNPTNYEDIHTNKNTYGVTIQMSSTLLNPIITASWTGVYLQNSADLIANLINPTIDATVPVTIGHATGIINEQYTVNITVVDKNGTGIVGATVACAGSDSGTASEEYDTVGFTTADTGASGVLAPQTVTAKKWVGTSETLTNYNYFKFTITEPGYETLVMEKVTIDAPIVWHLELQPIKHPVGIWMDER